MSGQPARASWWSRHWFLTALILVLATGTLASESLQFLTRVPWLREGIVFGVMLCAGFTLQLAAVARAVTQPTAISLAIGMNLAGVPILAFLIGRTLAPEWLAGLMIAAWMPCTLASAAVWTRKADGDDSVALITTVVTNLGCVVVTPLGLWLTGLADLSVGGGAGMNDGGLFDAMQWDGRDQVIKLAGLVVAPLVLGQMLRRGRVAAWADQQKVTLGNVAQIGILIMVLFGGIASASTIATTSDSSIGVWHRIVGIGRLLIAASLVHGLALAAGIAMARRLGCDRPSQIAVGIAGSQKTLMVGLQVAIDCGVSVLPMIAYHVLQLVIDTIWAERWKRRRG